MLCITIELLPGGSEHGRRVLASGEIARVTGGRLATYSVALSEESLGSIGNCKLVAYPRYAATIWDMVARCVAIAMTGHEQLPVRPGLPEVPVRRAGSVAYVRLSEIPQPARALFERNLQSSTQTLIAGVDESCDCVRLTLWESFLDGNR